MKALGMAMGILGYALFYSGASNLFSNGKGWGFLQSLLNKGEGNIVPNFFGSTSSDSGSSSESTPSKKSDPCRLLIGPMKTYCEQDTIATGGTNTTMSSVAGYIKSVATS